MSPLRRRFESACRVAAAIALLGAGVVVGPAVAIAGVGCGDTMWTNAAGGLWDNGSNWSGGVPDGTKSACLPNLGGGYTVTLPSNDTAPVSYADYSALALVLQSGVTLTLQSDEVANGGLNTNTLTVTNDITVTSAVIKIGTGLAVHGTTVLASTSGTLHVDGTALVPGSITSSGSTNQSTRTSISVRLDRCWASSAYKQPRAVQQSTTEECGAFPPKVR
jgi:hypothetical protein